MKSALSRLATQDKKPAKTPTAYPGNGATMDEIQRWAIQRALKLEGPLDFESVGILNAIAEPLADAGVSILASISTLVWTLSRSTEVMTSRPAASPATPMSLVAPGSNLRPSS